MTRPMLIAAALLTATPFVSVAASPVPAAATGPEDAARPQILATMKRATRFMTETLAYRGGYVWTYLPDRSRRWGELEASPTMIWVQPPGTATMGHLFLDAYHATADPFYLRAAEKVGDALAAGQLPRGGWNYFIDFGDPAATARWYATIGRNAWRMEEFQHFWGNATFDDAGTSEAMQFLLRLVVDRPEPRYRAALAKSLGLVLDSQMANGGWPQRFPAVHGKDLPEYPNLLTFNDDVARENIRFLRLYQQTIGDPRIPAAIGRAMNAFVVTQQPAPQAGWGLQHDQALKPAGARSYEPTALVTHTTAANIRELIGFYRMTGDTRYLEGVPAALDWLESVRLPKDQWVDGRQFPTFVQVGTNRPLYVHRRGSNVVNGAYYVDHDPTHTIGHYNARRGIDTARLRADYERAKAEPVPDAASQAAKRPLDRFWLAPSRRSVPDAATLASTLNAEGWWPTRLKSTSNPYVADGSPTVAPGDFRKTTVGDASDTSPHDVADGPIGISIETYIDNMTALIGTLRRDGGH